MTPPERLVLEAYQMQDVVHYILEHHAPPSTLVVCSSKQVFLEAFQAEAGRFRSGDVQPRATEGTLGTTSTLRMLATSRGVQVAFCPDITHLRAYLATYRMPYSAREPLGCSAIRHSCTSPILAILNPIDLHRPTSAFSAQGLNRTLASAVEAAHRTASRLIVAECSSAAELETNISHHNQTTSGERGESDTQWDEELPILNATTKRLGGMSVGRTVKARTIAERWCVFERLHAQHDP